MDSLFLLFIHSGILLKIVTVIAKGPERIKFNSEILGVLGVGTNILVRGFLDNTYF